MVCVWGPSVPKALGPLGGRPLVCGPSTALRAGGVDEVVVAVPAPQRAAFAAVLPGDVHVVVGGDTRTASVRGRAGRRAASTSTSCSSTTPPGR